MAPADGAIWWETPMHVQYSRLYATSDGASSFEDQETELKLGFAVPPAEPLHSAQFAPARDAFWVGAAPTWKGDAPHPAPRRMVFVTVRGEYQITATNGETRTFPVGSVLVLEDTSGAGHMTKSSGSEDTIVLAVGLASAAEPA